MAVAAEADEVDHHILAELPAVLGGQLCGVHHGLGVLAVHVQDRHHEHLGNVRGIARGAGVLGQCRVADLVVDDDVDGPAGPVAVELGHVQGFGHHPLAGEGRVAVDQKRQDLFVGPAAGELLAGAGKALHHGVYDLEVARVVHQEQAHIAPVRGPDVAQIAVVVFDVAGTDEVFRVVAVFKLAEDVRERLADDVGLDIEPAAVGHAEDDLPAARMGGLLHEDIQGRNEGIPALQGKARHADVLRVQELLEDAALDELFQDAALRGRVEGRLVAHGLHAVDQPAALVRVLQVHELHPDRVAVGLAEARQDVPQRGFQVRGTVGDEKRPLEVREGKPEGVQAEQGVFGGAGLQGVEAGEQVPDFAVAGDQGVHARLAQHLVRVGGPGRRQPAGGGKLKAFEEKAPVRGDGGRVGCPSGVLFFDEIQIQGGEGVHGGIAPWKRFRQIDCAADNKKKAGECQTLIAGVTGASNNFAVNRIS